MGLSGDYPPAGAASMTPDEPQRCGTNDGVLVPPYDLDRLIGALSVALSWHDNPTQGTPDQRKQELQGCRRVLGWFATSNMEAS